MPGKRMIHVNICRSAKVNAVSQGAEMLWIRILTLVDDNGNYDRDPMLVYASGAKHKKGVKLEHVSKWMDELVEIGLLQTYSFEGQDYIHFADFHEYQHLRADRGVVVTWPIHPDEMGSGFTESGTAASVRREMETNGQPSDNQSVHQSPANPHHEVEVEVKRKVEGEVEAQGNHDDDQNGFAEKPCDWRSFQRAFKDASGVKPNEKFHGRLYSELCQRFSEDDIREVIGDFVEKHGGKVKTRKNQWAVKNFLEEAEDLIESKRDVVEEEAIPAEIAKIARFRVPSVQM